MYFKQLPQILYNFPIGDTEKVIIVRDITANVRVLKEVLENVTLYDEYDIVDGETPEIVSEKIYGSPTYHWALMIANQRFDYVNDWPLTYDRIQQYCIDKYGEEEIYYTHHYENVDGYVVNSDAFGATPISNIDYELSENEKKRRIKLISRDLLNQLVNQFNKLFSA